MSKLNSSKLGDVPQDAVEEEYHAYLADLDAKLEELEEESVAEAKAVENFILWVFLVSMLLLVVLRAVFL